MGAKEPPARFTQRLRHFFLSDFQSSYPIVQDILYKEKEGIRYFPYWCSLGLGFYSSLFSG